MAKSSLLMIITAIGMLVLTTVMLYLNKPKSAIISIDFVKRYYLELSSDRVLRVTFGEMKMFLDDNFPSGRFYRINGYKTRKLTEQEFNNLIELASMLDNESDKGGIYFFEKDLAIVTYKNYTHEIFYSLYEHPEEFSDIFDVGKLWDGDEKYVHKLVNKFIEYSPMPITLFDNKKEN